MTDCIWIDSLILSFLEQKLRLVSIHQNYASSPWKTWGKKSNKTNVIFCPLRYRQARGGLKKFTTKSVMFFHLNLICVPLTCGFQYLEGRTVTFICFVFDDKLPREVMRHSKAPLSFFKGIHTNKQYCPPRSIFQHLPRYENNLAYLWLSVSRGTDGNIRFVSFLTTRFSGWR